MTAPVRRFQPLRDLPTVIWLALVVIVSIAHRDLAAPRWLLIHLLFLGAATHAIFVWSQHFTLALTRSVLTNADRHSQAWRLALVNAGAIAVMIGVVTPVLTAAVAGAAAVVIAVLWHGVSLVRRARRALPGRFTRTIRYYIASATLLAIGAALGAWLAHETSDGLVLAHAIINILGWVGLTIAGTLVTLWPTILGTRAADGAETGAVRALPVLAAGVVVAALGASIEWVPVLALGLVGYLAGLSILSVSLWRSARDAPPRRFAALSIGAGVLWWIGGLATIIGSLSMAWVSNEGITFVRGSVDAVVPYLATGFVAQVLIGALSHLVPVAIGGGRDAVQAGSAAFDRGGPLRISVANVALLVCALPVASLTRVVASILVLIALGSFLLILFFAMRAQRRQKPPADETPGRRSGQAVAGMLAVVLAVAVTVAIDPASAGMGFGAPGAGPAAASGSNAPVTRVTVEAHDMQFTPNTIEVSAGSHLVIELTNTDAEQVHDLVVENGARSLRLAPGASETLDVGVVTNDLAGWCSIVGHRQMGMTLTIVVTGGGNAGSQTGDPEERSDAKAHDGHAMPGIDLTADPAPDFTPFDATLPPLPPADGPVRHEVTLPVTEQVQEVAPGVRQRLWTFGGTAPGPTLHGRVGDTFVITLVNDGTIGHSIDFHAGALAPDEPMRTIAPGESLTYAFTATRSGIWLYHCATVPMSAHIANGMYGAVIIEPDDLPEVDRSFALVQAEYYLGDQDGEVDIEKLVAGQADLVAFNGYAAQYDHAQLSAEVGERVRVWMLVAGPNRASSFHVVGGQFDTVWMEGRYLINRVDNTGSQALGLLPAQGGFVELVFPEVGHYPFVSHIMSDAERGARGIFQVTDSPRAH